MNKNSVCKKISALLSLYIENNLTEKEKIFIEEHLKDCKNCNDKYVYLKYLINDLKSSYRQIQELSKQKQNRLSYSIKEHENFLNNISPFVDNELNNEDSISVKKHLSKSQTAQKELRNIYSLQKKLQVSFDVIKRQNNKQLSKDIIKLLKARRKNHKTQKFKNSFSSQQTIKITVLIGLLVFGGYEVEQLLKLNYPIKQQTIQIQSDVKNSVSKIFENFKLFILNP